MADNENTSGEWRERIDEDVRTLGADVKLMGERIVGVESGISNLGRSFDRFYQSFEKSSTNQRELQRTQWPVIFGTVSILLILGGALGSGYLRDQNRIEKDVTVIKSKRISENDPVQDARIKDLEEEVIAIRANEHETILQDAQIATTVDELWERRNQVLEHMMDGHPRRIEGMLRDQLQGLRDHEEQALRRTERERVIYRELQNGLKERLDLMEDRWAAEHLTVHEGGHD